jgi:hypothetical protein
MRIRTLAAAFILIILIAAAPNRLAAQSSSGTALTKLNLKTTLENMGFETKDLGANTYQITLNQGTIIPMSVSLSTDESGIWLITFFADKVLANYSADKLIKLLQSNWSTGVSFFVLNGNKLEMLHPIENRNITTILLRKEIESHARTVTSTEPLWNEK